jgi:uncharacterized protein with HEPN domain
VNSPGGRPCRLRDWKLRITDILDAIEAIRQYTAGMDFNAFAKDNKTIGAVLRNFTILGEAARCSPEEIAARHPEIPWQNMRDMRNVMVHVYFRGRKQILWETIPNDLPPLIEPLKTILP